MFTFFHEHFKVVYKPRGLTTWLIYVVCLLAVLVLPVVIGLSMKNFWVEQNNIYEMPYTYLTGRCALRVTTMLGKEYLWSCNEAFNEQFLIGDPREMIPFYSYEQEDTDGDNKNDLITLTLRFPVNDFDLSLYANSADGVALPAGTPIDVVKEVSFLPEMVYRLKNYVVNINMTAAPLLTFVNPSAVVRTSDGGAFSSAPLCAVTEGDLTFHTTRQIIDSPYVYYSHTYTDSPLEDQVHQPADLMNLAAFAKKYTGRNQSVEVRRFYETSGGLDLLASTGAVTRGAWEDMDQVNDFTWRIRLRIYPANVPYVPSYAETLKWGWVQYFVIAYLLQWFLWKVRGMLARLGLIDTNAERVIPLHHHRSPKA